MFKVALKNVFSHKFRSLALVLTVVLGVSFVSGTYVLTDTISNVFDELFEDAYATVDVTVRSESDLGIETARAPVPESLLEAVQSVDGVEVAEGGIFSTGVIIIDATGNRVGNEMAPTFGVSWSEDDALTPLVLREGRKPAGSNEVAIDARSFKDGGFRVGDQVRIVTPHGPQDFTLVGVAGFGRADNIAGATLSVFDLATAQTVMERVGAFDTIDILASPSISVDSLQDAVAAVLPDGYEAVTSDQLSQEASEAIDEGLSFFNTFLLVFAFIALFVGAFIIYNTFGIVVTQRTRELALLRALGASGRQVMTSVVAESVVLGAVASVIGLGAGVLIASGLKALLAGFGLDVPSGSMVVLRRTVIVSLLGGTLITAVSSIAPAVRAARVPPIAALGAFTRTRRSVAVRRNIAGLVLLVVGVALVITGLGNGTLSYVGIGALMTFVGVAMLAPMIARPVAGVLGSPLPATRGAAGLMARENAMRSPRRTAATASALMIGTALMAGSLILSSSITRSVERAVSRGALADLVITAPGEMGFSPALAGEVATRPGVAAAHSYRFGAFKIGDATKHLAALPPTALDVNDPDAALDIDVVAGTILDLAGDGIAVKRSVAKDRGWALGDEVTVTFPTGDNQLRVVALHDENTLVGDYVIALDTFAANYAESNDFMVLVALEDGADLRAVQADLRAVAAPYDPGLEVQDRDEYIGDVKAQVNQFLGLITALLALAVLIALLGVLITMLLAVYERTRELGLLRAVGMGRRQMRSMVRWEAAIVSVYGALLGVALGAFFGLSLVRAMVDQGVTERVVPVLSLGVLAVVIALLGVGAALYPARRAARLNILDAIAHE